MRVTAPVRAVFRVKTRFLDQIGRDAAVDNAECPSHDLGAAREQETQQIGNTEHPLAYRLLGKHLVDQQRRTLRHAPGTATGALNRRERFRTASAGPNGAGQDARNKSHAACSPRYQFTDKAEHDLEGINYTAQEWGAAQANIYLDGQESQAQLLAENPDLGMTRETLFEGLLSFPYESHVLYYKKQALGIVIIRVLHHHMDPTKHL